MVLVVWCWDVMLWCCSLVMMVWCDDDGGCGKNKRNTDSGRYVMSMMGMMN